MIYWMTRFTAWVLLKIFYRLKVEGDENIVASGGAILAPNHSSFLDPPAIGCAARRRVSFVARSSLTASRFYRFFTAKLDIVAIDRSRGDREALRVVRQRLKEGALCAVFPEGTRSADGRLLPLKRGVVLMARGADVPLIPVWISGTRDIWPRQRRFPRPFGRITVRFGPPIDVIDGDRDESLMRLREAILALSNDTPNARSPAMAAGPGGSSAPGCGTVSSTASAVAADLFR